MTAVELDWTTVEIRFFRRGEGDVSSSSSSSGSGSASSAVALNWPNCLLFPAPPVSATAAKTVPESDPTTPVDPSGRHELTEPTGTILGVNLDSVVSEFHLHGAIFRALSYVHDRRAKSKTLLTEILYQLSSSGNINEAIRQYFLTNNASEVALLRVAGDSDTVFLYNKLCADILLSGAIEFQLESTWREDKSKRERLQKQFKLSSQECDVQHFEDSILTKLALKDFTN